MSERIDPAVEFEAAFETAWNDERRTRYELPPVDVNAVLAERYHLDRELVLTRAMLWDLEVRKAWQPDLYIPYVVRAGTAAAWDHDAETDTFVRRSEQRLWLSPEEYGLVLERTYRNHEEQRVTFLGVAEYPGPDGETLRASTRQPLFHVEHAVGGEEERPLNLWRIVHLTDSVDERLLEVFGRIAGNPMLPEFVEIYLREVQGIDVKPR